MAGSPPLCLRRGPCAAAFAVSILTLASGVRAQDTPPPPAGAPAMVVAEGVASAVPPVAMPVPMAVPGPTVYPVSGGTPTAPRAQLGLFDTIAESICGEADPDLWHPLPLSTLFSEGWNEAWVPSPNGSGGAPRQGWINALDGNLYRLWFFTFAQAFNDPPKGNAYLGSYTIFTPLSRRLELIVNIPFVVRNNASSGLPTINPGNPLSAPSQSHSGVGDISFTPRILLHETQDFSLTSEMAIVVPTGTEPLAGKTTTLIPTLGFWNNFAGGCVIRGGLGVAIPMDGSGDKLISQLAIGQTLTAHDVPLFGDFTYYLSAVANTPLGNSDQTSAVLTPGLRTHVGDNWYFLAGLPIPVTKERVGDIGMIFWFMKAW